MELKLDNIMQSVFTRYMHLCLPLVSTYFPILETYICIYLYCFCGLFLLSLLAVLTSSIIALVEKATKAFILAHLFKKTFST